MLKLLKKNSKIFLILSLICYSNTLFAQDIVFIKKDDKAAFDGLLFPIDKAEQQRKVTLERDYYLLENKSLRQSYDLELKINENQQNKINMLVENDDKLAVDLAKANGMSNWERAAWFGVGLLTGFLAIYGAKQITK